MKRLSRHVLPRVALAVVFAATLMPVDSAGAQASTVETDAGVSNIEQASAGAVPISGFSTSAPDFLKQPFRTGSDADFYEISSVEVALGSITEPPPGEEALLNLRIRILDTIREGGSSGKIKPHSSICGKLTPPPTFEANAVNTWTADSACRLNHSSTYWVELKHITTTRNPSNVSVELKYTTAAEDPVSGDFAFDPSHDDNPVDFAQSDGQSAADWKIPLLYKEVYNDTTDVRPIAGRALLIDVNDVNSATAVLPGLTVDPTELSVVEDGTATFEVELATAPAANVTVAVTSGDTDVATVTSGASLTFTAADWSTAQTVTVGGTADGDVDVTATAASTDSDYEGLTGTVAVTVTDKPAVTVTVLTDPFTITEQGADGRYTVVLDAQPASDVVIDMAASGDARVSVGGSTPASTASLTFTDMNWNSPQTVTVTAVHDDDANDDVAEITLEVDADDSSEEYDTVTISPVAVNITDDDDAGLVIEPTDLAITEGAAAGVGHTYTVKLATEPDADVNVGITGHAGTTAVLTGFTNDTLTFTSGNWHMAQTVTVTAADDDDDDDETVTLSHEASSTDTDYDALAGNDVTVTIEDDDEAGLIFDINPLELAVGEESSADFTIRLASRPQATVSITFTGQAGSDISLSGDAQSNILSFTAAEWNTDKTVTVSAAHDDDGRDDTVVLGLTTSTSDSAYGNLAAVQIPVTVTDNDEAGLIFSQNPLDPLDRLDPLELAVGEEVPVSYTVRLATEPQAAVSVLLGSDPVTSLTMSGDVADFALTFEPGDWDTPQTVTFEVDHDDDGRDGSFNLVNSPSSNGDSDYNDLAGRSIAVTVTDDDIPAVIVDHTEITAVEGSSQNFTVRLATEPSDEVIVTISGHTGTDATLSGSDVTSDALTFAVGDWDTPQTVTVTAAEDVDSAEDKVILSYTATSTGDTEYDNLTDDLVKVTITDNDSPAVAVNPTAIDVDEGGSASYTVQLVTQPATDVTVTVTVPANSGASLSGGTLTRDLTFTSLTWSTPQTVTVVGADDDDARDSAPFDITHTSSGADYDNVTIGSVTVTVIDDDEAGLVIEPAAIDVEEEGSAGYTVRLTTEPSADVIVDIGGHIGTDASLSGSDVTSDALTFTPGNWDTPQTVTVVAAADGDADDEAPVNLTHSASSADPQYDTLAGDPVRVAIADNDDVGTVGSDTAAVLVSVDSFDLVEGESDDYTVVLGTEPTQDVTISIIGNTGSDVSVTGNTLSNDVTLTFTAANYSTAQTVTVTANQDDDAIDESDVTLTHVAASADTDYNGISGDSVTVAVDDDDTAGVTVSPTELSVTEGSSNTYEVSLGSQPTADVTVTIAGHDRSDLTLTGNTLNNDNELTFTAANWDTAQTVTVTAAEDPDAGTDAPVELTHTAASNDADYDGVSVGSVTVAIAENDTAEITVSTAQLTVDEIGTGTYTVVLSHPPVSEVTVKITDAGDMNTNPTQLAFDASDWDTPQTVTVIAGNDDDAYDDTVEITHAVVEGSADEYFQLTVAAVTVTVTDTDTAGLSVSSRAIGILEEGTGTYTVALTSEPSDEVTVDITEGGPVTVEPAILTFRADNWDTLQTVTVTIAHDDNTISENITLDHTTDSDAPDYKGVIASVAVTVSDNDAAGVVLSPQHLTVIEGETGAYSVSLSQAPTADVTIEVTGRAGVVTVNDGDTARVTFTPSNWDQPRKVTVAATQNDDDANSDITVPITNRIVAGDATEYGNLAVNDVTVTILDDDGPALRINTEELSVTSARSAVYTVSLNSAPDPGAVLTSVPPRFEAPEVRTDLDPRPATDVDVTIYASGDLSVEPTVLRFTASNWDVPQKVRVTANGAAAGTRFTIVHAIAGPTYYADVSNAGLGLTVRRSSGGGSPGGSGSGSRGGSGSGGGGGGGDLDVGVATFVVANGWSAADVGVASVLAARTSEAVVVYTAGNELSEETRVLLREALPAEVIIVGGNAAVSRDVRTQIRAASSESGISRITGEDRSDTAAATARRILGAPSAAGRVTLVVANGWSPPDIGAATALAASSGRSAVLYTERDSLPEASAALLRDYDVARVMLIGGTAAISGDVQDAVAAAAGDASISRLTGTDRIDTAAQAARRVLGNPAAAPDGVTLVIANGWSAPDVGVAAALAAATENAAVAYTAQGELPETTAALIRDYRPGQVIIVGGRAAVANDVRTAITQTAPDNADIRRITGSTRTDTAVRAARRILANL
ncbi:cell wall-binding repeat-containing protein [Candidatus Poriferisodalis sp.]|uniref:cell wall-binding repeat-containing protein n=1 Tax=Candidatus Poriferisodalis sp. TaxID=3101277 RepID=UPI003AF6D578